MEYVLVFLKLLDLICKKDNPLKILFSIVFRTCSPRIKYFLKWADSFKCFKLRL